MAVDRADVCVIMIDATEGFTEQDSKVAGYAHEQGQASVIAIRRKDDAGIHKEARGRFFVYVIRSVCVYFGAYRTKGG